MKCEADQSLVTAAATEQEHVRSLKVDPAVRRRKAAKRANFLQGAEKGIVSLDGIDRVFEWLGRGLRSLEHGPQSILDERAQGLPVPAGLLFRQVQKSLINVQTRLHHMELRRAGVVVNAGYLGEGIQSLPPTSLVSARWGCWAGG